MQRLVENAEKEKAELQSQLEDERKYKLFLLVNITELTNCLKLAESFVSFKIFPTKRQCSIVEVAFSSM